MIFNYLLNFVFLVDKLVAGQPKRKFYNKYQMWRIYPTTKEHVNFLEDFRFSTEENEIQWWKGPTLRYLEYNLFYVSR